MNLSELIDKVLPITAVDKGCKIRLHHKELAREKAKEHIAQYVADQLPKLIKMITNDTKGTTESETAV